MDNIKKIQSMLRGNYGKIQVGAEPKTIEQRVEGEEWTSANGHKWIKENGKRKQITKIPPKGFDKCKDCEKLILKTIDQQTYNRMQRCLYCQIDFEAALKTKGKWKEWVMEQEKLRWESIEKEVISVMKEMKDQSDKQFDPSVAYAVGNEEQRKNKRKITRETNA